MFTGLRVRIIKVLDPFDRRKQEILDLPWEPDKPVRAYLDEARIDVDTIKSLNGRVLSDLDEEAPVPPDSSIVVVPLIEGPIAGLLAAIAVTVAAVVVPKLLGLTGIWATLLGLGIMMGGMMLINAVFPPPKPKVKLPDIDTSPTYSWEGIQLVSTQGFPIPVLYGKHRMGGNVISKSVEVAGNSQVLNMLIALCHGKVASIEDIRINNNPISFYPDVSWEIRYGTNQQEPPRYFNVLEVDNPVNFKLEAGVERIVRTQGNMVDAVRIDFVLPAGLYSINDMGGMDPLFVEIDIYYRLVPNGSFAFWKRVKITEAQAKTLRYSYKLTGLSPGQYDIKVVRVTPDRAGIRIADEVYLANVCEIVSSDLAYPNVALLAIRALATDQLSGSLPNVTCLVDRGTFSPDDHGIVPTLVGKPSNNPAWACYDILTNRLYGGGLPETRLDYDSFAEWASFCSASNLKCNIVFDSTTTIWDACLRLSNIGRAILKLEGTTISVAIDKPSTPVQVFSVGNIVKDSFKETFLPKAERANCLEVVFWNEEHDYQREVFMVYTPEWLTEPEVKQTLELVGVTNYQQAVKEATYRLNYNRFLTRTVEFEVDVDAIACTVGDVIRVQHDIPRWGEGGRVVEAGPNYVKLDKIVRIESGKTYVFICRLQDDTIIEKQFVASSTEETDILPINFGTTYPAPYDVYLFGEYQKAYKDFRVISITRTDELKRKITAIEYNESIYTERPITTSPEPPVLSLSASNLTAKEVIIDGPDGKTSVVDLLWTVESTFVTAWNVYYRVKLAADGFGNGEYGWTPYGEEHEGAEGWIFYKQVRGNHCRVDIDFLYSCLYEFAVCGVSPLGVESPEKASKVAIIIKGPPLGPKWPEGAQIVGSFGKTLEITWPKVLSADISHYELHYIESQQPVVIKTQSNHHSIINPKQRSYTFTVYAVDVWGNKSVPLTATFQNTAPPPPSSLYVSTSNLRVAISWSPVVVEDIIGYNVYIDGELKAFVQSPVYIFVAEPEKTYQIQVASVDEIGEGPKSGVVIAETPPLIAPNSITRDLLADSAVTAEKLADGAITQLKVQAGEALLRIVNSLPNLPNDLFPIGSVVYLVQDGKLYRNQNNVWVRNVDAADITGQITSTQISDSAITTPKLAANAITSEKIAANAVTAEKIAAGAVTAAKIAAGAVTTDGIAANAVTAEKIAAGAVGTTHLQAGSVTAEKINVSQLSAISANMGEITAGLIRATSGNAKIEIDASNKRIRIYDENGVLRVVMGYLS